VIYRRIVFAAIVSAALGLAGCDKLLPNLKSPFNSVDVTGSPLGNEFTLADPDGKPRSLSEFRGKVVVVTFGYTHCPDVCPTTLADFASALKRLGNDGKLVQLLFVTVDPKRDTPELLRQYVPAFDPGFIGLRGDEPTTEKVAKAFHVYVKPDPPKDAGAAHSGTGSNNYTVSHSAQSFVFDRDGKIRLVVGYGLPPEKIAADLKVLINS
jgi:protein SCO1/2